MIEPNHYIPILPSVLINGCDGIGTGWSTKIPPFNPLDLVENILNLMKGDPLKELHPWYWGYLGKVSKINGDQNYILSGNYRIIDDQHVEVTELPPTQWPFEFKTKIEKLI